MRLESLTLLFFLAALVVVGARLGFSSLDSLNGRFSGFRVLAETGTPFIAIGALVGPQVLNILSAELLRELSSLLILGFGLIGFLYGSHFEWRRMRLFPSRLYWAAAFQSVFTLGVVALVYWVAIPWMHPGTDRMLALAVALAMGACAAGTAPAGVFLLAASRRVRRADIQVLRFFAAVDDLPALVMLVVIFSMVYPGEAPLLLVGWQRLLLPLALGLLIGLVTHWLFPTSGDERQNTLILLGMAAAGSGASALLAVSPLFVGVVAGIMFGNLSTRKESAYGLLASREHSFYAVFLLVAGAMFRFKGTRALLVLAPAYVLVRGLAKVGGGYLGRQLFMRHTRVSKSIGAGLLSQGGMPLVLAVHFEHSLGVSLTYLVMTSFLVAVLINDVLASSIATAILRRRQ